MPITFVPQRGQILMCDFDMARVPPEMRKVRRAVVVSRRAYNRRHGSRPGTCTVVPISASQPQDGLPSDVSLAPGIYRSLQVPTWAICSHIDTVSHDRLDRVAYRSGFLSEHMSPADMARIEAALRQVQGL